MKKVASFLSLFILPVALILGFILQSGMSSPSDHKKKSVESTDIFGDTKQKHFWADSVLNTLNLDEKIGQLFMVAAYSNKGAEHEKKIIDLIENHHIGGLIFFQGGPYRQVRQTNIYQSKARVPLLLSIDGEWGLAMRLDSTIKYPRQMTLGAIEDNSLIYAMGKDIAEQCKRIGLHVNLAPVLDINNNPKNPVIGSRSFGEVKENVAEKGIAYMKGMQDNYVMANGKHFPGHGDTDSDSHKTLPTISGNLERLKSLEFYPFERAIDSGIGSMMVAHLYIPALDSTPNSASTLSKKIVTDLLKKEMDFKGLVFTDALNMKGVSSYFPPGIVDLKALLAGNDVLLFSEDVPLAIKVIKEAIDKGEISEKEIEKRCKKILIAKEWAGVTRTPNINNDSTLYNDLHNPNYYANLRKIIEASSTLLKNDNKLIPLKRLDTLNIASVSLGTNKITSFQQSASLYKSIDLYSIPSLESSSEQQKLRAHLDKYNLILFSIHNTNERPSKNFGIEKASISFIEELAKTKKVIVSLHGNPYALNNFSDLSNIEGLLLMYTDNDLTGDYAAQGIFGGIPLTGTIPVSTKFFKAGDGIKIRNRTRFSYTIPEELGIPSFSLTKIDTIVLAAMADSTFPGCQVFVAQKGKVIYNKSFGYHTYDSIRKVNNNDLYDIASVTKITSSVLALMHLNGTKEIHMDSSLSHYIPSIVDSTPYQNLYFREILAHQAGLQPWIPFYFKTIKRGGGGRPKYYQPQFSESFDIRVAENMYINHSYVDTIMNTITRTKLRKEKKYKYSDLGYYFAKSVIEKITYTPLDRYVQEVFYNRLGLATTTYHPRRKFNLSHIVPTENDTLFRQQLVHGDVHDPGAAMMGGVGGHAGLFSNANDLGKIMQMYMNWGKYGGERYIRSSILKEFTSSQFPENDNRRAMGFDKPTEPGTPGPTTRLASPESFGHSGFTGTLVWADPKHELVYVFLSNRVYPDANNKKLARNGIRTRIMRVIYDAVIAAEQQKKA